MGSNESIKEDTRIIAATNRDLERAVEAGLFRQDLFYSLNVFPVKVPPLRERKTDIPLLVNYFISKFAEKLGKRYGNVSKETMKSLMNYSWPGNVRELQNVIERAVVISRGSIVDIDQSALFGLGTPISDKLEDVERTHWKAQGKGGATEILGIKPSTLRYRMKKLGIKRPES